MPQQPSIWKTIVLDLHMEITKVWLIIFLLRNHYAMQHWPWILIVRSFLSLDVNHTETIGTELLNFPGFNEKSVTDSSAFYVKIFGVKLATALTEDRSGYVTTPLTGWFHLVISLDNPVSEPITRLVINARGYMSAYGWMSGVGDFLPAIQNCVDEEKQQIEDPEKVYSSWDKDIEFIPCGGVSAFEPTVSAMIQNYPTLRTYHSSDRETIIIRDSDSLIIYRCLVGMWNHMEQNTTTVTSRSSI